MDSIPSMLFAIYAGEAARGSVVGRDEVGEYTIDTCYTLDQGWETAVWKGDAGEIIIVGRYATEEDAKDGHETWCEVCKQLEPSSAWSVQTDQIEFF